MLYINYLEPRMLIADEGIFLLMESHMDPLFIQVKTSL